MDVESLDRSQNPVNLNFHHQEELVGRSQEELQQFDTIMSQPIDQRRENLRLWYDECIERIEARKESQGTSVKALDFEALCDAINKADSVKFFGGASVDILQRFIQKGVASKIKVHVQVVSTHISISKDEADISRDPVIFPQIYSPINSTLLLTPPLRDMFSRTTRNSPTSQSSHHTPHKALSTLCSV